jgi:hypothetical protein
MDVALPVMRWNVYRTGKERGPMKDPVCEKTGTPCRFCSDERVTNVSRVGVLATGQIEIRETVTRIGQWCNNDGKHPVRDLPYCPIPAALNAPKVNLEISELEWLQRRM